MVVKCIFKKTVYILYFPVFQNLKSRPPAKTSKENNIYIFGWEEISEVMLKYDTDLTVWACMAGHLRA